MIKMSYQRSERATMARGRRQCRLLRCWRCRRARQMPKRPARQPTRRPCCADQSVVDQSQRRVLCPAGLVAGAGLACSLLQSSCHRLSSSSCSFLDYALHLCLTPSICAVSRLTSIVSHHHAPPYHHRLLYRRFQPVRPSRPERPLKRPDLGRRNLVYHRRLLAGTHTLLHVVFL